MQILIVAVGRIGRGPERDLTDRYLGRVRQIGRGAGVTGIQEIEIPEAQLPERNLRRDQEAERVLQKLGEGSRVVLLDETGESLTSAAFSRCIQSDIETGIRTLAFLIGGPDGHGAGVRARADRVVSFGRQTMPHKITRAVLAEQIYRAATLALGHPYHRD